MATPQEIQASSFVYGNGFTTLTNAES